MKRRILWIEDDYYAIKGLVRPLEKAGFQVDVAISAVEGFHKARNWQAYDLIMVDLIQPLSNGEARLSKKVESWSNETHVGIGLLKWLMLDLKPECPVMVLSVVRDPIKTYDLNNLGLVGYLPKSGLLPSHVKEEVFKVLKLDL